MIDQHNLLRRLLQSCILISITAAILSCRAQKEEAIDAYLSELGIEHMRVNAFCVETEGGMACTPEETESQEEKSAGEYPYIDYDYIEQYHEILFHNITTAPKGDYDDTVLAEYLKEDIEKDKELLKYGSGEERPLTITYHEFDFNNDGLEDYLVCLEGTFWRYDDKNTVRIYMQEQNGTLREAFTGYVYCYHGSGWSGTAGNHVCIYIQKSDGTLSSVFSITMRLYDYVSRYDHSPMAILDEKDDGYYAFVLVGNNRIIRYNKEEKKYQFEDEN